jgi:hypothetical protein
MKLYEKYNKEKKIKNPSSNCLNELVKGYLEAQYIFIYTN